MRNQKNLTKNLPKKLPKSYMIYHENPEVFHTGTLPPHSYFIPFGEGEKPFESREKSSRFESLNGEWGFTHYSSIIDLEDDFVVKKGIKILLLFSSLIPIPLSEIFIIDLSFLCVNDISI